MIIVLIVVWIGFSGYQKIEESTTRDSVTLIIPRLRNILMAERHRRKRNKILCNERRKGSMVSSILSFILFREKPAGLLTDVKTCKKLLRIILEKTLEKAGCVVYNGFKW